MSTVPLWVTIMLGVMAVVGTIAGGWGGQVIAARRDDKRWEREAAREDQRWEREQRREELRWQREHEKRRLEARQLAYGEALLAVQRWYDEIEDWQRFLSIEESRRPSLAELPTLERHARSTAAAVELTGSEAAAQALREVVRAFTGMYYGFEAAAEWMNEEQERFGRRLDDGDAEESLSELREIFRREVLELDGTRAITPTPPSDSAS